MSAPDLRSNPPTDVSNSKLIRSAMWVAIGALIAAAILCVIWVLVGPQNGRIGRAILTVLLLAAFAGAAILDAHLASRRPPWFALTSMVVWVVTLLIGAFLIWMPEDDFSSFGSGVGRVISFLLIVLVLQLGLLHIRLFTRLLERNRTQFIVVIGYITMALVTLLAVMLVLPLMLNEWVIFHDIYWRLVVAVTILAAVGTALVPLMHVLLSPRRDRPHTAPQLPPGWPTYVDGTTPLPVLPDGSPDWNAYYTGYPSPGAVAVPAPHQVAQPEPPRQQWGQQQWAQPPSGQPQWSDAQWSQSQAPGSPQQWPQQQWAQPQQLPSNPPEQFPAQQQPPVPQQQPPVPQQSPVPPAPQHPPTQPPAGTWPPPAPPAPYQGYPPPPPLPPK